MAQQTAVEWLIKEIQNRQNGIVDTLPVLSTDELYAKAKQMHKQQVIDAYKHGQKNEFSHVMVGKILITGEEYYNQTYTQSGTEQD